MAVRNFVPQLWSARLLANLQNAHVFANLVNRDYEGEIKAGGDTVKINTIGRITIGDYTPNQDMKKAEDVTSTQTELKIDQFKYFNFQVDDVDKAQANVTLMDKYLAQAGYDMAQEIDMAIVEKAYPEAGNTVGSDDAPVTLSKENVYDTLVDMSVALDEKNVASNDRFIVIPAWAKGMVQKSPEFTSASALGDQVKTKGHIGEIAGFNVYVSANLPNEDGANYKILAGHRMAITFAEQIVEVEAYRPELRFADAVKGLHVFGIGVVQPDALVTLTANKA